MSAPSATRVRIVPSAQNVTTVATNRAWTRRVRRLHVPKPRVLRLRVLMPRVVKGAMRSVAVASASRDRRPSTS